jgi:lipopolysaccharide transport system permease protein
MTSASEQSRPQIEVVIQRSRGLMPIRWHELWEYRDLFWQFVRRDFATKYRQTLLGPLWYILQPLLVTSVFTVVFGRIARLSTEQTPPALFYLAGLLGWTYFAQTMPAIAGTFTVHAGMFSKVYFPRLTVPLSVMVTNLISLGLQYVAFGSLWLYYRGMTAFSGHLLPGIGFALGLLLLAHVQVMLLALGVGCLLAATTGKYRDIQHLIPVVIQLWLYATPIVYPLSMISKEANWRWVATLNPMSAPTEAIRLALLGQSSWTPQLALGAWLVTLLLLVLGLAAFSKAERTVVDVV